MLNSALRRSFAVVPTQAGIYPDAGLHIVPKRRIYGQPPTSFPRHPAATRKPHPVYPLYPCHCQTRHSNPQPSFRRKPESAPMMDSVLCQSDGFTDSPLYRFPDIPTQPGIYTDTGLHLTPERRIYGPPPTSSPRHPAATRNPHPVYPLHPCHCQTRHPGGLFLTPRRFISSSPA